MITNIRAPALLYDPIRTKYTTRVQFMSYKGLSRTTADTHDPDKASVMPAICYEYGGMKTCRRIIFEP